MNRLIRYSMDAGKPLIVEFRKGLYQDVRLQIIREGINRETIYLREHAQREGTSNSLTYYNQAQCNREGENCRVQSADFAIGPGICAPLILRSKRPGAAVFDGSGLRDFPQIDSTALLISGAVFGSPGPACTESTSPRIQQVSVEGLVFRNYRNGIQVTYGEEIIISDCWIESIGSHLLRKDSSEPFGTFALRADGDSRNVLFRDNVVQDVWNLGASKGSQKDDPGLIHSIYQGYSHDILFLNNRFSGCSGPMVKFGYYPSTRSGKILCTYPDTPRARCTVLLGNCFELTSNLAGGALIPLYTPQLAFIEENSMTQDGHASTAPAAGVIFINNSFINNAHLPFDVPVVFVRQELPVTQPRILLPGWIFSNNKIFGVSPVDLMATRMRGTPVTISSIKRIPLDDPVLSDVLLNNNLSSRLTTTAKVVDPERLLLSSIAKLPGSHAPEEDSRLVNLAQTGTMPWRQTLAELEAN